MAQNILKPDSTFTRELMEAGGESLKKCYQCATCSVACPMAPENAPYPRKEMVWASWGLKEKLATDVDLWLYVSNFNPANGIDTTNVKVYPHIEEPDFPLKAQGHFGLLWDGPSLQQCQGEWGDNILYTLPHKMSLYFECHLPVVTWSQSASAPYLRENNLGILVDSLFDLNDRLKAVTPEEYDAMQQNVCRIAEPIAQGEYMREAMRKVDKDFRSRRYR